MGGGDLNQKKSWHTQKATNVIATRRAEEATIAERKLAAQRQEEIRLERKQKEIEDALEAAGGKKRLDRVEWMYQGPTDGQAGDAGEKEAYLLGKRRIDKLLQDNETKKLQKQASFTESIAGATPSLVTNARDTAAKIREDPLMAIKRQEQEAYSAIMNNPTKRKQLLASLGIEDTAKPDADDKDRGHRRHHHRHRHHHRRHRRDRDESRSDDERRSRRRTARSDSRDRSRSPRRQTARSDSPRDRSRSPRRLDSEGDRRRARRRSRSPPRRRRQDGAEAGAGADAGERTRKIAAMQSAASELDRDRERRMAAIEEAERLEQEANDRERQNKDGGSTGFIGKLYSRAADMKVAARRKAQETVPNRDTQE